MTQNFKWLLMLAVVSLSWSGCYFSDDDDGGFFRCEDGVGEVITEVVNLPTFTGIKLSSHVDVYLKQGPDQLVEVQGQENIIDLLELDVQNGIWDIEFDRCIRDSRDFKIFITLPLIDYVAVSGSGKVYGENEWSGEEITLRVSGSGDLDLAMTMEPHRQQNFRLW